MKTGFILSIVLLVVVVIFGVWSESVIDEQSGRYISASQEILTLTVSGQWERADEIAQAYNAELTATTKWLCILINHDEVEHLSSALYDLRAAILARSQTDTIHACYVLENAARRIEDRNCFMLENIL